MIAYKGSTLSFNAKMQGDMIVISVSGQMDVKNIASIEPLLERLLNQNIQSKTFLWNLKSVTHFDTSAALLISLFNTKTEHIGMSTTIEALEEHMKIYNAVSSRSYKKQQIHHSTLNFIATIGKKTIKKYARFKDFLAFTGKLFSAMLINIHAPQTIRIKEIYHAIEESSIKALGIIALTSFLIGVVLAYQSSIQLKMYGANIFIVDMLGVSILRELSPLIAAIVIAGRSGSAFAAQIGVMKITEELDAMRTMGFDPYLFLVLPRIIALMVMMPLIIFFADVMAMLGGMLIAKIELGISSGLFLDRFVEAVAIKHFFIGIVKGPFFGFLIAAIGVFRGLMVENDTQSIGINTTKSVVEAIFTVIICDAIFSIIFTNMGI